MWGGGWEKALSKKPRALNSVILDEDLATDLLADARDFLKSADWYQSVGIPYRRGYLLYGPPGCGKTSFCQALAGALKLDVCMLTLTNKNLDDNGLASCLRDAPSSAIVLLEDVDAVRHRHRN
jgi:chaperone BCS1